MDNPVTEPVEEETVSNPNPKNSQYPAGLDSKIRILYTTAAHLWLLAEMPFSLFQLQSVLPDAQFSAKIGYLLRWLSGKIFIRRLADFLAIFEIFRRKIWWIFVHNLDQSLVEL